MCNFNIPRLHAIASSAIMSSSILQLHYRNGKTMEACKAVPAAVSRHLTRKARLTGFLT
jgi:hypothetical protein